MSIKSWPLRAPALMPLGPRATASTSGEFGSIVMIASDAVATSAGEFAGDAPSLTRASTEARLRLWTVSGKPARIRFAAIGFPMIPRPMNPIFVAIWMDLQNSLLTSEGDLLLFFLQF